MPRRTIPGTDVAYYLVCYDADGRERLEPDGTRLSETVRARVADASDPVTDVFFTSHGWKGDVPAAITQYDAWVGAMAALGTDRAHARARRQGFTPLTVGIHWPSLPWGDETIPTAHTVGLLAPTDRRAGAEGETVDAYAERIADTPAARTALTTILDAAARGIEPAPDGTLPPDVGAAYATLFAESGLGARGRVAGGGAAPGADQDGFDPAAIVRDAAAIGVPSEAGVPAAGDAIAADPGPGLLGDSGDHWPRDLLLSPLRQLSFWKIKKRAHVIGEQGAHALLVALQRAAPRATRFHLMGHSFGCIVVTGAVAGPASGDPLPRPVDTLFLVQGALSLWAYAPDIPYAPGTPGYYARVVGGGRVDGPIITTRSTHDTAVGRFYPLGAELERQVVLAADEYPKYGGVGAFGIQGLAARETDARMQPADAAYGFARGRIYNLDASDVIRHGTGASGAHSDIAHPEVAHAFWEGVLAE